MTRRRGPQPEIIVHADWSVHPRKRWACRATRGDAGIYRVAAPTLVGCLDQFFPDLCRDTPRGGAILAGFDFPLGLPAAYARKVGITDFPDALKRFGRGRWKAFYNVANETDEISPFRPFFPQRPGRKGEFARAQLARGLSMDHFDDLLRQVDRPTGDRPAASVMFWTMGGKQVGKATITGWRDLLEPVLRKAELDVALWPFDGALGACLTAARITVVEAYPAEYYRHLDLPLVRTGSKRRQDSRVESGAALTTWARKSGVRLNPTLRNELQKGFGERADGEDPFDAVVGTLGLLNVALGLRPAYDPVDPVLRRVEGWTLGQAP